MTIQQLEEYEQLLSEYKDQYPDAESPEAMLSQIGMLEVLELMRKNKGKRLEVELDPERFDREIFIFV